MDACTDGGRDGQPDLFLANYWTAAAGFGGEADLFVESDGGDFSTSAITGLSASSAWWSEPADLDGDGYPDVVATNSYLGGARCIYWGSASGYSDTDCTELNDGPGDWALPLILGNASW